MQLTLVLPELIAQRADTAAIHAPALAHLIALAGTPRREEGGPAAALAARYGVTRQIDWPLAPLRLAALDVDPEDAYWLAADPVTLEAGRADVSLTGIVADLEREDADALLATLNAHFAADGLTFVAPRPDTFFVRAARPMRLATRSPGAALGRPMRAMLPQGEDAPGFRRWQSEVEMLLHEHPVNLARERAGRPAANSLWFSGGGTLPRPPAPAPSIRTYATADVAVALAHFIGQPARPPRAHLDATLLDAGSAESIVVVLEGTREIAALERSWAAPARDALTRGALREVTVLCDDAGDAVIWRAERPGPWQRLTGRHRAHDLAALLDAAEKNR